MNIHKNIIFPKIMKIYEPTQYILTTINLRDQDRINNQFGIYLTWYDMLANGSKRTHRYIYMGCSRNKLWEVWRNISLHSTVHKSSWLIFRNYHNPPNIYLNCLLSTLCMYQYFFLIILNVLDNLSNNPSINRCWFCCGIIQYLFFCMIQPSCLLIGEKRLMSNIKKIKQKPWFSQSMSRPQEYCYRGSIQFDDFTSYVKNFNNCFIKINTLKKSVSKRSILYTQSQWRHKTWRI